jgi:hypothetical protein
LVGDDSMLTAHDVVARSVTIGRRQFHTAPTLSRLQLAGVPLNTVHPPACCPSANHESCRESPDEAEC